MKGNTWKIVGVVAMAAGAIFGFIADMADGKKTELTIKEEVAKEVAKLVEKKG